MNLNSIRKIVVCALFLGTSVLATAQSLSSSSIPDPLKTWVPWVLDDIPNHTCLRAYNDAAQTQCSWPGRMELQATDKSAKFKQNWKIFSPSWVPLPGNEKIWPLQVQANNQDIPVILKDNVPAIFLQPGEYTISAQYRWFQIPETLALNSPTAVLDLNINGVNVPSPKRSATHEIKLQSRAGNANQEETQVSVFRKIKDDIPLQYETLIRLNIAGKGREIVLPNVVLKDSIPFAISSGLGVQVQPNGDVKIQAVSGQHEVQIQARFLAKPTEIALPEAVEAREEIWSFQANPEIRAVSIEGANAIDPQQSLLPQNWKSLPAYLVRSGAKLQLVETRRGDTNQSPDQLKLQREWWLSFDGKKMSMMDTISGLVQRPGRLDVQPGTQLGRVASSETPQLITLSPTNLSGIEIARGNLAMTADSTAERTWSSLSAVSWARNFDQVGINLNLPPGWRLLHASGVDHAPGTWITQWDLLQIFVVLLITFSFRQLVGNRVALLALVTMLLTYQESGAPQYTWLAILLIVGLLRVLPAGNLRVWFNRFRFLGLTILILMSLSFITDQVRSAIYPVLELDSYAQSGMQPKQHAAAPAAPAEVIPAAPADAIPPPPAMMKSRSQAAETEMKTPLRTASSPPISYYDLDARVQTGPGMPTWRWQSIQLSYDGAVSQDQRVRLILLSPAMNKVLTIVRILLLISLIYLLVRAHRSDNPTNSGDSMLKNFRFPSFKRGSSTASSFVLSALCLFGAFGASDGFAQISSKEQLEELKQKITRPPSCLPRCAEFSQLQIQIQNNELSLRLTLDAQESVSYPLPLQTQSWLPQQAMLNKQAAHIRVDEQGWAWIALPRGSHVLELTGSLKNLDAINLPLATKPHWVELVGNDWQLSGWNSEQGSGDNLQITRKQTQTTKGDSSTVPAFVNVTRAISIDKEWTVTTTVERLNGQGAVVFQLPILDGESITTPGIQVANGMVSVNLGGNNVQQSWRSVMKPRELLSLTAGTGDYSEIWSVESIPSWHVESKGIPPVANNDVNIRAQVYRPWQGEKLDLSITRPKVQAGANLTILKSELMTFPGGRNTDYQLKLSLRSAMGGEHKIVLPNDAVLQNVLIQNSPQPIQLQKNAQGLLELPLPLVPGVQHIEITWRSAQDLSTWFKTQSVDLKIPSTNHWSSILIPEGRWLLWVSGPGVGPALLFWGQLFILFCAGLALSRYVELPLRRLDWLLLALGLTQVQWASCAIVVAWFFAMNSRKKLGNLEKTWQFNARQVLLIILSIAMVSVLGTVVVHGLLGHPYMQLSGLLFDGRQPLWYMDQIEAMLPQFGVVTLPLLSYRLLMLVWALWLVSRLLLWLKWGWSAWSEQGIWRKKVIATATDVSETKM